MSETEWAEVRGKIIKGIEQKLPKLLLEKVTLKDPPSILWDLPEEGIDLAKQWLEVCFLRVTVLVLQETE